MMRIIECYVENFGKLHKYKYRVNCGLNVMCEGNGSGKTTLAVFIRAMFYGMPATRTKKTLDDAERKKYKPWQGGLWGGYLSFEKDGKEYRIERTFSDRDSQDTFRLLDMNTGLISEDYSRNIGEELFGIDRTGFSSSIYVTSGDLKVSLNDSLSARIGDCTIEDDDLNNYDRAINLLNNQYKRYGKNGKPHVLQDLEHIRSVYEEKKAQYDALKMVTAPPAMEVYPQWKLDAKQIDRLEQLDDFFGAGVPAKEQLEQWESVLAECREHPVTQQQGSNRTDVRPSLAFVLCAIICMMFAWAGIYPVQLDLAGVVFLAVAGVILYWNVRGLRKSRMAATKVKLQGLTNIKLLGQVEEFLKGFGLTKETDYDNEEQRIEKYSQRLVYLDKLRIEYEYLSEKERDYRQAVKELREKQTQHEQDIYMRERQKLAEEIHDLEIKLGRMEQGFEMAKKQMQINEKTRHFLEQSRNQMIAGYLQGIRQYFMKYMNMFDSQLAGRLSLDVEFNVGVDEDGMLRELDYYSQGYKDIIRLCQRLALMESLFQKEKPFIILDDPFVNLDDEMLGRAKQALDKLSKHMQVIYFTCSWTRDMEDSD